jgi:hypothetical protein
MSDLHKAAQQALEALESYRNMMFVEAGCRFKEGEAAITALHTALALPDEPKGGGNLPPPLAGRAGAAAQREKLAHWMRSMGYATGHGDTIEDLLDHLGTQISEGLEVEAVIRARSKP